MTPEQDRMLQRRLASERYHHFRTDQRHLALAECAAARRVFPLADMVVGSFQGVYGILTREAAEISQVETIRPMPETPRYIRIEASLLANNLRESMWAEIVRNLGLTMYYTLTASPRPAEPPYGVENLLSRLHDILPTAPPDVADLIEELQDELAWYRDHLSGTSA